ncbi:MAG: cytochrome c oxidase assembly protein [Streptosporangiaceae bacterium]
MNGVFSHWSASWPVLICYLAVAAAHVAGLRRRLSAGATALADGATRQQLRREGLLFQLGLLIVLLALVSPMGYWSDVYIWVRAVQQLLVAVTGPGLIVLGAPWAALAQSVRPRRSVGGQIGEAAAPAPGSPAPGSLLGRSAAQDRPAPYRPAQPRWLLAQPLLWVIAFNAVWIGLQVPVLFDLARGNAAVALAEHASYLAAGIMFWLQFSGSRPLSPQTPPLRRVKMLVGTVITTTVLGMVLAFGPDVVYPAYEVAGHQILTVLDDQQLAGAVLWMGMLPALIVACIALLLEWFAKEESAELSAGLDRLVSPRKSAWPSRPVIR